MHCGVPLITISSFLGHSDARTTMRYLGLDLDDLNAGASLYDEYFSSITKGTLENAKDNEPAKRICFGKNPSGPNAI